MDVVAHEKGVLKLVHRGRCVEVHHEPIRAIEVLKRNPRHSITRPDFFKFPSIVIHPDSVLKLGKVFFIVPNGTIYRLLKAHEEKHFSSDDKKNSSPIRSRAAMAPKNLFNNNNSCLFPAKECLKIEDGHDNQLEKPREKIDIRFASLAKNEHNYLLRSRKDDGKLQENQRMKSCLRKQGSERKLLGLRVKFALPCEDDHKKRIDEFEDCRGFFIHSSNLVSTNGKKRGVFT